MSKNRILHFLLVLLAFSNFTHATADSKLDINFNCKSQNLTLPAKTINGSDSIIFDLASATLTPTYIEFPVYIISDDPIFSFDFAFQFNLSKITYTSAIDLLTDPSIISLAYFNPNDLFLRYTTSALNSYPTTGVNITKIRFNIAAICTPISSADFSNVLTILNGKQCSNRFTNLSFSKFIPVASFTVGPTCNNAPTNFYNTSTIGNGTLSTFAWAFSNGSTSGQSNAQTSFTGLGAASGSLIVTAANGCSDTTSANLNINPAPVPSFSFSFDCVKDSVFFVSTSTISTGSVSSFRWFFDLPSDSSNAQNPTYHFNGGGPYSISLTAISSLSCQATKTNTIVLGNKVAAGFSLTTKSFCIGSVLSFSDVSTYTAGTIASWKWDFGTGQISNLQNPSYTYSIAGNYSITLTAFGSDGCNGKYTLPVTIYSLPIVQFSAANATICAGAAQQFTNSSNTPTNSTFQWIFGDGGTSSLQTPNYSYSVAGVFNTKLIVVSPAGCIDSLLSAISTTVFNSPSVKFTHSGACVNTSISFINKSSILTGSILSNSWTFGDGESSTGFNAGHTYTSTGNFTVTLVATSELGCSASNSVALQTTIKPTLNFTQSNFVDCLGDLLTFNNTSFANANANYSWSFGDGGKSNEVNPSYRFVSNGYYPIKLVITNPGGCADSITKPYIVTLPALVEAVISESITANGVVNFSNQSLNAVRSEWDFGDGQSSNKNKVTHVFPEVGTYTICLTAYNSLNCVSQTCKEVFVGMSRVLGIPLAFTPNNDGNNDVFVVRGGPFVSMELRIYNQWGNLLFTSTDQQIGWDGTFNGELQAIGAYEYVFTARTLDNIHYNRYGIVNLVR